MKVSVVCTTCDAVVAGPIDTDDLVVAGMLLIPPHATPPHDGGHVLKITIDDADLPYETSPEDWKVRIVCGPCRAESRYSVPKELASAVVIAHHSSHEGHPLQIFLDQGKGERRIHPPPKF